MSITFGAGVSLGPGVSIVAAPPVTLFAWGTNTSGQLGLGDADNRSSPTQVGALTNWGNLANSTSASAAIKNDGTLWSWGTGSSGVSGLGDTAARSSPTQVGSLTSWASVSTSTTHRLAIKTDGTLWSWGYNGKGQLGLGDTANRSSPVQVGALTTWATVMGAGRESAAIKTDGTLWTWGWNLDPSFHHADGVLGQNDTITRSSPTQVGALTTWSKLTGAAFAYNYPAMIAIKTTGVAWGWGSYNRLIGNSNATSPTSSPVQVSGGLTWAKINLGSHYNVNGVTTDGKMWVWGFLTRGTGGNSIFTGYIQSDPLQSGALTTWSQSNTASTVGLKCCLALKTDGSLWAWGANDNGVLGLGTASAYLPGQGGRYSNDASSPIQVGSVTTWTVVTASTHALAIQTG